MTTYVRAKVRSNLLSIIPFSLERAWLTTYHLAPVNIALDLPVVSLVPPIDEYILPTDLRVLAAA